MRVGREGRVQLGDAVDAGEVEDGGEPVLLLEEDVRWGAEFGEERGEGGGDCGFVNAVCMV